MKHRVIHSTALRTRLPEYATRLDTSVDDLTQAYQWMLANDVAFEEGNEQAPRVSICSIDIEERISDPLARRFYAMLRDEVPATFFPVYGYNWKTLKHRWLRAWEQWYNILINKIPSHHARIAWLRLGGARIGKGSTIWRHTEVIGMDALVLGEDSCIGWHCQIDARAGLIIGDHVTIASHVKLIAGTHDVMSPEFWAIAGTIYVEDYVWLATGATIGHGVRIGRGAVVTANTLVSKDIAPYKIVGGSGAKPMGERPHNLNYKVGGKGLFTLFH